MAVTGISRDRYTSSAHPDRDPAWPWSCLRHGIELMAGDPQDIGDLPVERPAFILWPDRKTDTMQVKIGATATSRHAE